MSKQLLEQILGITASTLDNSEHLTVKTIEQIQSLAQSALDNSKNESDDTLVLQATPDIHVNAPLSHFQPISGYMAYVDCYETFNRVKSELDAFKRCDVSEDIVLDLIPVEELDCDIGETLVDIFGKENAELMIGELVMICLVQPIEHYTEE